MSVRCGNCKGTHESVSDVRSCYTGHRDPLNVTNTPSVERERASRDRYGVPQGGSFNNGGRFRDNTATDNQRKYITDLRAQKGLDPLAFAGTRHQASVEIDRLKALPDNDKGKRPGFAYPAVEDGRYAIVTSERVTKFYKVKNGFKRVFLDVQASDTWYPVKATYARQEILADIARNPKAAMLLYGQEIGSCGHCGRTLTDEESRAFGVGPICRAKLGW